MSADRWLAEHRDGVERGEALARFRALQPVTPDQMLGRWRGSGLPTGSPLDGLLEAYGWYGKEFVDAETVHPLLFDTRSGPRPVDPALIPVSVLRDRPGLAHSRAARLAFRTVRPLLTTTKPKARLRAVQHSGVVTAAMVYDALPIIDVFKQVSPDVRLGLMDLRGLSSFFFLLHRDSPAG
ncbi:GXWXG domain-containing protein [Blastococcus capsensis]|uniref:GXWXG domain-containing protein n=1 Tax=Blastococcus capsensis TaxID=1564163 RepID=UPI00254180DA|nr:GXWXG domain-containing protein [Blastococcus capsensis]MDK3257887.1 GXWXG domain-containing protein [Blastococcus capsensis]